MKLGLLRRLRRRIILLIARRQDHLLSVKSYSMKGVKKATNEFTKILVNNGDVTVYAAQFPNGVVATVKRVHKLESQQAEEAFYEEIRRLGRLHHRNVVRLYGFAVGDKRLFIFEHMENGSLRDCLNDPLRTPLDWRTRVNIAMDVAAALEYLCYCCTPPALHVSVNSSNVLLDAEYVAKLSDVAFISYGAEDSDRSIASLDDYKEHKLRELVFQFGILVLELVTGLPIGSGNERAEWIQGSRFDIPMHEIVDSDLGSGYSPEELRILLGVAGFCLRNWTDRTVSVTAVYRYLMQKLEHHRAGRGEV